MTRIVAPYVGGYFLIMGLILFAVSWQNVDWTVMGLMTSGYDARLSPDIVIADVPYDADREIYRTRICRVLRALGSTDRALPKAIALDIHIENEPAGLTKLEECIRDIQEKDVRVYAAIDPRDLGNFMQDYLDRHAALYDELLDGMGHTRFDVLRGIAKYDPYLRLGDNSIPALPITIAEQHFARPADASAKPIVLHLGKQADVAGQTLALSGAENMSLQDACSDLTTGQLNRASKDCTRNKIVIVGSQAKDIIEPLEPRSGPQLLAWALSERILPADLASPKLLASPTLLLSFTLLFSTATFLVLGVLMRRSPPVPGILWLLGCAAAAACIIAFGLIVAALRLLDYVYAQVTVVVAAILVTAFLSCAFVRRRALITDVSNGAPAAAEFYDIFISYSRTPENLSWVRDHLYEPLTHKTRSDGSSLRIFFDQRSLRIGVYWYTELTRALHGSRLFLSVYSSDYFDKPFCKFEVERAFIKDASRPGFVLPIARGQVNVPPQYSHVQFANVDAQPDYFESLYKVINERLAAGATPAQH